MAANATSRWSDTFVLRQIVLSHTLPRIGKTSGELYRDILDDYGSCGRRRFARALRLLVLDKYVVSRGEFSDELNQYVPRYFRGHRDIYERAPLAPKPKNYSCRICGLMRTYTCQHPLHRNAFSALHGSTPQYTPLGRITRCSRTTLRLVHYGKHIERTRRYHVLPLPVERDDHIDRVRGRRYRGV